MEAFQFSSLQDFKRFSFLLFSMRFICGLNQMFTCFAELIMCLRASPSHLAEGPRNRIVAGSIVGSTKTLPHYCPFFVKSATGIATKTHWTLHWSASCQAQHFYCGKRIVHFWCGKMIVHLRKITKFKWDPYCSPYPYCHHGKHKIQKLEAWGTKGKKNSEEEKQLQKNVLHVSQDSIIGNGQNTQAFL